jgi:hypothetical protein
MNKNKLTNTTILYVIATTMLSAVAFFFVVSTELPQNAVGQAEEVFNENATFIQELEGGSPTATANQTGESGAAAPAATNQTGESGAAAPAATNQTGDGGDILSSISEGLKGLFGMK